MKAAARKHLFGFLFVFIFSHVAMAQNSVNPDMLSADAPGNAGASLDPGTSQLGIWVGYSSSNPTLIGRSTNRPFFELNVQYARVLRTGDNWSVKYIAEIMPVAIIKQPQQGYTVNGDPVDLPDSRRSIHGAGISPIGLQMNLRRGGVLQPYVNGTAGVLYFTENVPVSNSSNFNFIFGFGAGVETGIDRTSRLCLAISTSTSPTATPPPGIRAWTRTCSTRDMRGAGSSKIAWRAFSEICLS